MKGMERITTVRLAEVLSQSGVVSTEKITDALYHQDSTGVPFVEVLVESGQIAEWDLARLVVQHFQLPFLMASGLDINREAVDAIPEKFLFEHRLLPLDVAGNVLSIAMPLLVPYKVLAHAQKLSGKTVFPFVGLGSENLKFLFQLFPEHPRDEVTRRPLEDVDVEESAWQSIFDVGDQEVLKGLGS